MTVGLRVYTREELLELLELAKNTRDKYLSWGAPDTGTNSVDDLLRDVNDGSARLVLAEDVLICFRQSVCVIVFYRKPCGKLVRLYESYRILPSGKRRRDLPFLRESNIIAQENSVDTAVRCFAEELGIHDVTPDDFWDRYQSDFGEPYESELFPGLITVRNSVYVEHEMHKRHYRARGYRTRENDSTIVFTWRVALPKRAPKGASEGVLTAYHY